ncbi:hypothetical protein ACIQVT_12995 [Streptomyces sp. NPDC100445]|uniref:aromatic-ring hydroxylase C-terminal domain-containing protein n=1 Tax=Streptomyces sp. NPDC100445 TaxID=3366102 RepID=UPI00381537F3
MGRQGTAVAAGHFAGALVRCARQGIAVHAATLDRPPTAWTRVRAGLIRPDGHVAWAGEEDDAALAVAVETALAAAVPD